MTRHDALTRWWADLDGHQEVVTVHVQPHQVADFLAGVRVAAASTGWRS
ncbi:hypothetical protein [Kineococcus indalonis]|nr:hypothetical protein [Kineococcus indalonis]NAZ86926.1 hypothetical protein [Kineococcus indalonis]